MLYEITSQRWEDYQAAEDGLDAIASLGVEWPERFRPDGIIHDDGSVEPYEDFHARVANIVRDGGDVFEL